jgi:ribose transport system permease protein
MKSFSLASLARFQSLLALAVLMIALSLASDHFLTAENGVNILRQISVNLCLSIGLTLVILSGGIDLSVGAVLALAGAVAAGLLKSGIDLPMWNVHLELTVAGAVMVGVGVGVALGLLNGLMVTRLLIPPFVATLAMMSVARGLTQLWTGGYPISRLGAPFGFIGTGSFLAIPMPVWIVVVLCLITLVICHRTPFGRHLYAVGGSERAARLTGLNVDGIRVVVYVVGGALSGLAGILVTARLDSAQPNAGLGYELDAIAAVVIGGTSLSGGRGSVAGTALGCLLIGVLSNGLTLLNVSPFWQQIVKGAVIAVAVALDRRNSRQERLS